MYLKSFLEAGYDLAFISKFGLKDGDLDCVGIPNQKLGLRKKLLSLYHLEKFYKESSDESEHESDESEEEEEDDNDEEEEDEEEEEG